MAVGAAYALLFGRDACAADRREGTLLDGPLARTPGEAHRAVGHRRDRVADRAARPGVDREALRPRKVARGQVEEPQPRLRNRIAVHQQEGVALRPHGHRFGGVGEEQQLVALVGGDQPVFGHRRQDHRPGRCGPAAGKGAFGGCGEHLLRRFGPELHARRDLPLRRRPNARAARRRREAKRPAQHGGDVALRRGGFHEAPDTQQRPALRLRDAEVDRLRRVAREGVDDGTAERGVVVGNLSECYHTIGFFGGFVPGRNSPDRLSDAEPADGVPDTPAWGRRNVGSRGLPECRMARTGNALRTAGAVDKVSTSRR